MICGDVRSWANPHVKERLTGAIILVALMVLLVPELLTGPVRMSSSGPVPAAAVSARSSGTSARSARGEPPLRTYTLSLGAATPAQSVPGKPSATRESFNSATSAISAQQAPPAPNGSGETRSGATQAPAKAHAHTSALEPAAAAPAAKPTPALSPHPSHARRTRVAHRALQVAKPSAHRAVRATHAPPSAAGWVVQLGVFADRHNAARLASVLERRGFRIAVSRLRVRSRVLWRVSTAPPQSRTAAFHTAARLRAAGHRGDVLPAR
jgi:cell division septation protein DedD